MSFESLKVFDEIFFPKLLNFMNAKKMLIMHNLPAQTVHSVFCLIPRLRKEL